MIIEGVDLNKIDKTKVQFNKKQVYQLLEQRYEFEQIDYIIEVNTDKDYVIGYRKIIDDEFWISGHIPGNPLFPGVMMAEGLCQLTQFLYYYKHGKRKEKFLALAALDQMKFRKLVVPGDELIYFAKSKKVLGNAAKSRNYIIRNGELVLSGDFMGVLIPVQPPKS
ncbi:MAG: beta-hydroxyacyl-ACP dehydratase [Planctomycetes bacterium]|nr:beta-hydroxyacyl-ACP dehydratase [Planctomycetota bacterium]